VKQKRIEQLLQAVRMGFQEAGCPIDDVALDFAMWMARDLRFQQFTDKPEQIAIAAIAAGCLHWEKEYDAMPAEQWNQFLDNMKEELPYGLRPAFRTGLKNIAKSLPKRSSTGRNHALTTEQQKKACDLVSNYYRNGDSKRMAYQKVASEMDCSSRTVQRAWKERARLRGK
jgi:hypothetical protein